MTVKNKAKTPPPTKALKALKAGNQKTPMSAPPKSKGTPASMRKATKDMTPTAAKTPKILPKQLVTPKSMPKSTPKAQKTPVGKKTPLTLKKGELEDSDNDDEEDDDDFMTGEDDDMDGSDMSADDEVPQPVKQADKKKVATPQAALQSTPGTKGQKTPRNATPAVKTPKAETPAVKTPKAGTPAVKTPKAETPAVKTPKAATPAVKTPKAATPAVKTPKAGTPAVKDTKTPKTPKDAIPVVSGQMKLDLQAEIEKDEERRAERDRRTLFVKGLSISATELSMKALSKDIEAVRLRPMFRRGKRVPSFGFLLFKTEDIAKKNFKKLQGAKLDDKVLTVDFVGKNSQFKKDYSIKHLKPEEVDPTKLYVTGFGTDVTAANLKELFPKCSEVLLPVNPKSQASPGFAFVEFTSPELAREAHDRVQGTVFKTHEITVMFAKRQTESRPKKRKSEVNKKKAKAQQEKAKKKKTQPVEEDKGDDLDDIDFDSDDEDEDEDECDEASSGEDSDDGEESD